jgi:hypothetical protein
MADKSISDLTQATQITNDDLFVLQQGGEAKKLMGETLLDFVTLSVISVTVTTLPAGSAATATYDKATGTLTLGIPQGNKGDTGATGATGATGPQGEQGEQGVQGEQGIQGAKGDTGPANSLSIGTVTSGTVSSATITGTAPNQVLNLVLQKGDKGDTGAKGDTGSQGEQGIQGKTGPQGEQGADAPTITGITIRQSDYHMIVTLSDGTSYDAGYCRGASGSGTGDMLASVYDPQGKHQDFFAYIDTAIKGVSITTDATPTQGSANPVQSGGVYSALSGKLDTSGDGSSVTAAFTQASSRSNIATGEKLSVLFGKIMKWFADLGTLAFKSTVSKSDLASGVQTSLGKADTALQSYTESDPTVPDWAKAETKPTYTAAEVGADASGTAASAVSTHNSDTSAHSDIRNAIPTKTSDLTNDSGFITSAPTIPSTTSLLKGDGSGGVSAATANTDYTTPANVRTILNRTNNVNVANTSYTTYMARGEALFSSETTPTVNGTIAWQYE